MIEHQQSDMTWPIYKCHTAGGRSDKSPRAKSFLVSFGWLLCGGRMWKEALLHFTIDTARCGLFSMPTLVFTGRLVAVCSVLE